MIMCECIKWQDSEPELTQQLTSLIKVLAYDPRVGVGMFVCVGVCVCICVCVESTHQLAVTAQIWQPLSSSGNYWHLLTLATEGK